MAVWGQLGRLDRGSSSNEFSSAIGSDAQAGRACGRALGTGFAPGLDWEQEALVGCYGIPAFESLFLLLDLTPLICSGTRRCSCLQEDEQDLEEGLLQRGESLGFGL